MRIFFLLAIFLILTTGVFTAYQLLKKQNEELLKNNRQLEESLKNFRAIAYKNKEYLEDSKKKFGYGMAYSENIEKLSKEKKEALHKDLKDAVADVNDKDFKDKASYAKAMKDARTKVYKLFNAMFFTQV